MSSLSERDKRAVWHPFTPQLSEVPVAIVKGEGALLIDDSGKEYIDAIASWWVNVHGHAHPYIARRISEQLNSLEHSIFSGYTHQPGVELAEKLIALCPHMDKVFYSDDGSTSVEVAIKMALQYWFNKGQQRTKIIALENAYHGDTFGGMSVAERNVFSTAFHSLLFDVVRIPVPVKGKEKESISALIRNIDINTAAFIFEPLVQGAGGMVMYDEKVLDELIAVCRDNDVITIADEVMTGFGRTGKMFAADHCRNKPDIMCLSKGLTGGFFPLGATLCSKEIHSAYLTADRTKTFFHGHSYTANPLACTAALASLEVFETEETMRKVKHLEERFSLAAYKFSKNEKVKEARSKGAILAMEIKTPEATEYLNPLAEKVHAYFPKHGVILRPLGNVIYVLPPYCISDEQLDKVLDTIESFLNSL